MREKRKKHQVRRKAVQGIATVSQNAYLPGFLAGKIYSGPLKKFCVPGMNCYSCPGAVGACPIGSMQAVFSAKRPRFAFYVIGFLTVIGVLVGRFICGWLCVFGLVQELLYKIPTKKWTVPARIDGILRYAKYGFLLLFVVLLPLTLRTELGLASPYFCQWVCPVGMLEGGIPLLALDSSLRPLAGALYIWKFAVLAGVVLLSIFINRPFCKYICPLGAFYGLFQKIGFLKLRLSEDACVHCGTCARVCKMQVNPVRNPNSAECIRCGDCVHVCPHGALQFSFHEKTGTVPDPAGRAADA